MNLIYIYIYISYYNKNPSRISTEVLFFSTFTGSVLYFLFPTSTMQNIDETFCIKYLFDW